MATGNTKYGDGALEKNTANTAPAYDGINPAANNNSAFGIAALNSSTGYWNTAVGAYSGYATTTGISNTSLGTNTLFENTTGSYNTALGTGAMCFNKASNNTAVGSNAMEKNTTGFDNTAVGALALKTNTTGRENTAVGTSALGANTLGEFNTALGSGALEINSTGNDNTSVGAASLFVNTIGYSNTVVGTRALLKNTIGNQNIAIGANALTNNIDGDENTALGYNAGYTNSGNKNTFLGAETDASGVFLNSTAIGYGAQIDDDNQIKMGTITEQVVIPGSAILTNPSISSTYTNQSVVPKSYVDLIGTGVKITLSCQCATTGNIIFSPAPASIDGFTLVNGTRVLVKSQGAITSNENTANTTNGIYVYSSGTTSLTRAPDCASGDDVVGQLCFIENGTLNGYKAFIQYTNPCVVDTPPNNILQYTIFYQTTFSLGDGLILTGDTLSVDPILSGFLTFVGINGGNLTGFSLDTGTKDAVINGVRVGKGGGGSDQNTVVGNSSLANNSTGTANIAIGLYTLLNNSTGGSNIAIGNNALIYGNATNNVAIGHASMSIGSVSGTQNVGLGNFTLNNNSTGGNNVAIGHLSSTSNTIGSDNTSIGSFSLRWNTTGNENIGIGSYALNIANGSQNTAVGVNTLVLNTTGTQNCAFGNSALRNSTASQNNAFGALALGNNVDGIRNDAFGYAALGSNVSGVGNCAFGMGALQNSTTSGNCGFGDSALKFNVSGGGNTAVGNNAIGFAGMGYPAPTGSNNTAIGGTAGNLLQSGSSNIIIGSNAQVPNQSGNNQIAIGTSAETMYIQGGHNWRISPGIALNTTLSFPFYQVYPVTTGPITITLPTPTASMTGAHFVFKKIFAPGPDADITIFSGSGIVLYNGNSFLANNAYIAIGQFQSEFICSGSVYYQMFTM
jgi:hypothetical protein